MERQLFNWSSWDSIDFFVMEFYGVTLIQQIGKFPVGTRFDMATVNFDKGTLQLANTDKSDKNNKNKVIEYYDYNLVISVGPGTV